MDEISSSAAKNSNSCNYWQTDRMGLRSKLAHVCENKLGADLVVQVLQEVEFKCHRLILAMHSPVFETMLSDRWSKSEEGDAQSKSAIILPDVDVRVFQLALQFMYTEALPVALEWRTLLELLKFANVYHIQDLVDHCNEQLASKFTEKDPPAVGVGMEALTTGIHKESEPISSPAPDSVLEIALPIYEQAIQLSEAKLERISLDFIKKNATEILKSDSFLSISHVTLCRILELDGLQVDSELEVFQAVYKWADQECARQARDLNIENRRHVLGSALTRIRFPAIAPDEFATEVVPKALLTLEERVEVLTFFSMSPETRYRVDKLQYFKTRARCAAPSPLYTLRRFEGVGPTDFDFSRNWRNLCFQVDKPIKIVSLGFYGASSGQDAEFELRVSISYMEPQENAQIPPIRRLIYDSDKCHHHQQRRLAVPGSQKVFHFNLGESVPIQANREYSIGYIIVGPHTWQGDVLQDSMTVDTGAGAGRAPHGAVEFKFGLAKIKNNRYQIPEIRFTIT